MPSTLTGPLPFRALARLFEIDEPGESGYQTVMFPAELEVKCEDSLKDNQHVYALKARRKRIALIRVKAENKGSDDLRVPLGDAKLTAGGQSYGVESPATLLRKFSEFTWDFLLYAIFSFHPVLVVVDLFLLLTGPLYNRRLRKQLRSLSDGELLLKPGEGKEVLLGFRGVPKGTDQRRLLLYCGRDGERHEIDRVLV